jgi:GNAT superfamily N-acetyltransferase
MFPTAFRLESLRREHPRSRFQSGDPKVDDWLRTKALQHQRKHLSVTKVLVDRTGVIAGYYTLATGQVDFADLPAELFRRLPRRAMPVAVLAWLGVGAAYQGQGLGGSLLARALRDCHDASGTFAFVAVILDCTSDRARSFYKHWDFEPLPGHPYRLFLSAQRLQAMMANRD